MKGINPKSIQLAHLIKKSLQFPTFKPVLITDIDGVLVRGRIPIPQTAQALRRLIENRIPYACLTNGGGKLESDKVKSMNQIFEETLFFPDRMFMNHSPMKPELLKFKNKGTILISGTLQIEDILQNLKITNYITADEMHALYFTKGSQLYFDHNDYDLHSRKVEKQLTQKTVEQRLERKLSHHFHDEAKLISSIFAINDVSPYETSLQVMHNVLKHHHQESSEPLPFYAAQNDIVWAGGYKKPRMAFGPFNYILQEHCRRHNFHLIACNFFGKPEKKAFSFVEQEMRKVEPEGTFFMVGDNPRADIRGANRAGWYSFLTKTGIHDKQENSENDPATFLVQNFAEAIDILFETKQLLK